MQLDCRRKAQDALAPASGWRTVCARGCFAWFQYVVSCLWNHWINRLSTYLKNRWIMKKCYLPAYHWNVIVSVALPFLLNLFLLQKLHRGGEAVCLTQDHFTDGKWFRSVNVIHHHKKKEKRKKGKGKKNATESPVAAVWIEKLQGRGHFQMKILPLKNVSLDLL